MTERDNTTKVLTKFVAGLNIPVTRQSISEQLEKHPDYDSMLAFSDVLDFYKVPNAAYRLKPDELIDVPVPFIAHLSQRRFGVVTAYNDKYVKLSDERSTNKVLPIAEFNESYTGAVLVAEKDPASGEPAYNEKRKKELLETLRIPVALSASALLFILLLLQHTGFIASLNIPLALLTLFKTTGLVTAVMLLMQSINANNPLIQKICGSKKHQCNSILSSKAARINRYLSWSEVGFFYFFGTLLVLLLENTVTNIMPLLAILCILSLPYTFYSIYYQWNVARQWCRLCCAIQILLWLEFFTFLPFLMVHSLVLPSYKFMATILVDLVLPIVIWGLIKPLFFNAKQLKTLVESFNKLKYDSDVFRALLSAQVRYPILNDDYSFILGNPNAQTVITMVSSPKCPPCIEAHKLLKTWIGVREDIKLQIVFTVPNKSDDLNTKVATHLALLKSSGDTLIMKTALDAWYEQKYATVEEWKEHFPSVQTEVDDTLIVRQREWCKLTKIQATPTLFINGQKIPKTHLLEDIKYFI